VPSTSIHVLLAFDDNFWAPAYAVMRSICLATRRRKDLVFHLCEMGLTEPHKQDLERITTEFGAKLVFNDLTTNETFAKQIAELPRDNRLNHMMYARLMVDVLVPKNVERIIYFDCDTYIRGNIEELAEIDLQGKAIGAVEDAHADFITTKRDMAENKDLFDTADPYFNSGLLVIDTKKWRQAKVLDKLKQMVADGTMARLYYDQDFLNLVFKDNWFHLDQMWNVIDPRPPHETFGPKMLHYTGKRRPWKVLSYVAFARAYRHVMTNELFYRYMRHRWMQRIKKALRLK
jgi:lipopolysaccharide biosynthesis glycosyltransferase